jgi:ribosomal protein S18
MTWVASRMKKGCFEWSIGANDARTTKYEVSAAANTLQTVPLNIGIRVDTREGNGEYRRRRVVGPLPRFLSHFSHFVGLNVRIAPSRATTVPALVQREVHLIVRLMDSARHRHVTQSVSSPRR